MTADEFNALSREERDGRSLMQIGTIVKFNDFHGMERIGKVVWCKEDALGLDTLKGPVGMPGWVISPERATRLTAEEITVYKLMGSFLTRRGL